MAAAVMGGLRIPQKQSSVIAPSRAHLFPQCRFPSLSIFLRKLLLPLQCLLHPLLVGLLTRSRLCRTLFLTHLPCGVDAPLLLLPLLRNLRNDLLLHLLDVGGLFGNERVSTCRSTSQLLFLRFQCLPTRCQLLGTPLLVLFKPLLLFFRSPLLQCHDLAARREASMCSRVGAGAHNSRHCRETAEAAV